MLKYVVKRLAYAIMVLLGVSIILYFLIQLMPVDYVETKIAQMTTTGNTVSEETMEALKAQYGIGDKTPAGIIKGYFTWLTNMLQGNLGESFRHKIPVAQVIAEHMGTSFIIALIATIFEFMIAIPLGITAATHQYSLRDYVVTILVMVGISLPSFFFGNILKSVFAIDLKLFPISGLHDVTQSNSPFMYVVDTIWHCILPIVTVVILSIGARMRMTRTNMLEVMNSDYIRTARAKGLKESVVINKHAFRNTLIPLVTTMAGLIPALFSGAIITEQMFDLPGIGNVALTAMNEADIPLIMGYNMFLAVLSVMGVILADLAYAWVDPRVKLQ